MLARGTKDKEHAMAEALKNSICFVGIDVGKNSFHVVGLDGGGAIVLRQKWSRGQVAGQHVREYAALSDRDGSLRGRASSQPQDARLMPARYVRPYQRRFHYHLRSSGENTKARGYLGHELRVAARSGLWPLHWQDSKNFGSLRPKVAPCRNTSAPRWHDRRNAPRARPARTSRP